MKKHLIKKILKNDEGKNNSFSIDIMGEKRLVAYNSIENCDWFIVSTIPYTYLQSESKDLMWNIVFIGLICLVCAVPVSYHNII